MNKAGADWTLTFLQRKIASEEHNRLKWLQTHSETSIKYLDHLFWTIDEFEAHQYISGQNELRCRMNIAHNMFILPRDPKFVLPRPGSFKLLQDHSVAPRTIVKLLLLDEIEVFGPPVKQFLNSFTRPFKFYISDRQRGEIARWALSTSV